MKNKVPDPTNDSVEIVTYRGKQWTRRALGAFLNLVVLPGTGSFVLGRRTEGTVQLLAALAGLGMKIAGAAAVVARASTNLGALDMGSGAPDPKQVALQIAEAIQAGPPTIAGVSAIWMLFGGLALVVFAWVFSLISSLLPPRGRAWS